MGSWEVYRPSFSAVHTIIYDDGAAFWKTIAMCIIVGKDRHISRWLISNHFTINCRADRALKPVFFANKHLEATEVEKMGTLKNNYICVLL